MQDANEVPYKPERFDKAVDHYVAARVRYAPDMISWLAKDVGTEDKRVLDLGCGPGFIANEIAPFAQEVLGLDPSPNMINAAREAAAPNVQFEVGSSIDLCAVKAPVQLVTIGRAFHWMDRPQTLNDLDPLVAQDGAIAIINDRPIDVPMNRWWHDVNAVAKSYAVMDDYNKYRASDDWIPHEEVLAGSAFGALRRISVFETHVWSFDSLLRHTLSRSSTTEELIGAKLNELEAEMRKALAPHGPAPWTSLNEHMALIAARP